MVQCTWANLLSQAQWKPLPELRRRNKKVLFVSNKPLEPRASYADKLTRLGIPTDPG